MWQTYKHLWNQKQYPLRVLTGTLLLLVALVVNGYANTYTAAHASNASTDLLLGLLPVVDVHLIFSEGAMLFIAILAVIVAIDPKYLPFTLKSIATFVLIRSFFLVLTHLAPPADSIAINPTDYITRFSGGDDLFFSAHTGLPFMLMFVFWQRPKARAFFLFSSCVGGVAVLLGHLHYSIDVFSALFISFGIFHLCTHLFREEYTLIGGTTDH